MNVKKFLMLLLCVLLVAVPFAGCGDSAAPAESAGGAADAPAAEGAAPAGEGEPANLRVAVSMLSIKPFVKEVGDLYAERTPGVTFEVIDIPQDEFNDKVAVMFTGGDDVDVVIAGNNEAYLRYVKNGNIVDLTDLYARDNIDKAKFGGTVERFMINDRIYGMPYLNSVWIMFYNKDLFDKAGVAYPPSDGNWTWDDYRAMLPELTFGEGSEKVYGGFFMSWQACVQNIAVQSGAHITSERDYGFMKYAYDLVVGMQQEGTIVPFSLIQSNNLRYESAFLQQQVATCYQGSWLFTPILQAYAEGNVDFEWDVVQAPYAPDGKRGQQVGTSFVGTINVNAANPEHAWEYLKALTSEEGAAIIAKTGDLSATATDATFQQLADKEGMSPGVMEALKYDELYFEVAMHDLAGSLGQLWTEEHSLIMTESLSVDEGIAEMNSRAEPIWAEYDAGNLD